jgi:hypothetical protein
MIDRPKFPFIPPYSPSRAITINAAEFTALRTIVMALVADIAVTQGGNAQDWINKLSVRCQAAILASEVTIGNDRQAGKRLKSEVLKHINNILGGIRIPRNSDDAH